MKNKITISFSVLFLAVLFFSNITVVQAYANEPVAWWDFNSQGEISAGLVKDKVGSHNGQSFNGVYVNGYSGGALKIIDPSSPSGSGIPGSGGGDGVVVSNIPEISQATLTFRMKTDGTTNATEQVVVTQNREPTTDIAVSYKNGQISIGFHNGSLTANVNVDQDWHYYVITYDGRNTYLYVDGQVKGFSSAQSGVGKIATSKWVFGINPVIYETLTSPNTAANKRVNEITIDDFKIYNHIFSEAEIAYEKDNNQLCYADTWSCGEYPACSADGTQIRVCNKTFECSLVITPSPTTSQACTPPAPSCQADTWSCGDWNSCSASGNQTRSCTKTLDCSSANTPSPLTSQSCTPPAVTPSPTPTPIPTPTPTPTPTTQSTCTEDIWSCGDYNVCSVGGIQSRSCTKTFDCPNVQTATPTTDKSCQPSTQLQPTQNTEQKQNSFVDSILEKISSKKNETPLVPVKVEKKNVQEQTIEKSKVAEDSVLKSASTSQEIITDQSVASSTPENEEPIKPSVIERVIRWFLSLF